MRNLAVYLHNSRKTVANCIVLFTVIFHVNERSSSGLINLSAKATFSYRFTNSKGCLLALSLPLFLPLCLSTFLFIL